MARSPANLRCPKCQQLARYKTLGDRTVDLVRRYQCEACDFEYETREVVISGGLEVLVLSELPSWSQGTLEVRRTLTPYSQEVLDKQLQRIMRKVLASPDRAAIAERVTATFREQHVGWPTVPAADLDGIKAPPGWDLGSTTVVHADRLGLLVDEAIRFLSEPSNSTGERRERLRSAIALYRLNSPELTKGPSSTTRDLTGFAKWLRKILPTAAPPREPRGLGPVERWGSTVPDFKPTVVVKNRVDPTFHARAGTDQVTRPLREHVDFDIAKLDDSILGSLGGVPEANLDKAKAIRNWVLWSCHGQSVVRTSQLGAYIAGALRRYDPMAYLRWTIVGKELRLEEVYAETVALIESPSRPLDFDVAPWGQPSPATEPTALITGPTS